MTFKTPIAAALAAAVSLCALSATAGGPANVADEAAPAPLSAAARPAADWTGFWAGAAVGMGFTTYDIRGSVTSDGAPGQGIGLDLPDFGGNGGHFAVQLGYNRQTSNGLVWGVELDHRATEATTAASFDLAVGPTALGLGVNYKPRTLTTLSGRLGWEAAPGTLLYGLAGATRAKFEGQAYAALGSAETGSTFDLTVPGLTLGLGVETRLSERLSLKVDYRRTYLNDYSLVDTSIGDADLTADLQSNLDSFNVGLAFRF